MLITDEGTALVSAGAQKGGAFSGGGIIQIIGDASLAVIASAQNAHTIGVGSTGVSPRRQASELSPIDLHRLITIALLVLSFRVAADVECTHKFPQCGRLGAQFLAAGGRFLAAGRRLLGDLRYALNGL